MKAFHPQPLTYFYLSRPAPCPYLPYKSEQMVFTELAAKGQSTVLHNELSRAGFRRSQTIAYKPACPGCQACVPVRVRVADFQPRRRWRRIERRNFDLQARILPAVARDDHFALFRRYVTRRHNDGGMSGMDFDDYSAMLQDTPVETNVIEFRNRDGQLFACCLTDMLDDGLSLVYSFFDPDAGQRSLGHFVILWHLEHASHLELPYVYLGYWIEFSDKMAYKIQFRPIEMLCHDGWRDMEPPAGS